MGGRTPSPFVSRETILVKAIDGFPLAMEHFRPSDSGSFETPPIVLCPGFGGNRFNFDLDENHSLARYLVGEGFEVWLVELRGHGRSKWNSRSEQTGRDQTWNMDDHIEKDVPAILEAVTRLSKQPKLVWIGHSLGGMVAYCLLARQQERGRSFAGLITIGSPGRVDRKNGIQLIAATLLLGVLKRRATVPTRSVTQALFSSTAQRIGLRRLWRYWMNPENMDPYVLQKTLRLGVEDFSRGTLHQLVTSLRKHTLLSHDGSFDYFDNMNRINLPVLFIGGTEDYIVPPASICTVFERVQSSDKAIRIFGRKGFELVAGSNLQDRPDRIDYGHDDLLLGEASRSEVFPYIVDWLRARSGNHEVKI